MLIFHTDSKILMMLKDDNEQRAGKHIKNGYPELLPDWLAGKIYVTKLEGLFSDVIMDSGKPRIMTDAERKERDAERAAGIAAQQENRAYEAKIQNEIRTIAINSLNAKETR